MASIRENFEGTTVLPDIRLGEEMNITKEKGTQNHVLKIDVPKDPGVDPIDIDPLRFTPPKKWSDCRVRFRAKTYKSAPNITGWGGAIRSISFHIAGADLDPTLSLIGGSDNLAIEQHLHKTMISLRDDPPGPGWHTYEATLWAEETKTLEEGFVKKLKWKTVTYKVDGQLLLSYPINTMPSPTSKISGDIQGVYLSPGRSPVIMEWDDIEFTSGLGASGTFLGASGPNVRLIRNPFLSRLGANILGQLMDVVPWGDFPGNRTFVIDAPNEWDTPLLVYHHDKTVESHTWENIKRDLKGLTNYPLILCYVSTSTLSHFIANELFSRLPIHDIPVKVESFPDAKALREKWNSVYRSGPVPALEINA